MRYSDKNNEKRVLICGEVVMPDGNAQSTRLLSFGRIFRDLGYKVYSLGTSDSENGQQKGITGGCSYYNIRVDKSINRIKRRNVRKRKLLEYLQSLGKVDVIVISAGYEDSFYRAIRKYAKRTDALLIASVCEWYAFNQYPGIFGPLYILQNRIANIIVNKRVGHIISISKFFDEYYQARGCKSILIPTIVDTDSFEFIQNPSNERITIVYAGYPGRKDDLQTVIEGLGILNEEERSKVKVDIYGVDDSFFIKTYGITSDYIDSLEGSFETHGRLPYNEVLSKISSADFTVLLRPKKRYSEAGYPTKVGESMAAGVPVIANITSDLSRDIIDGKTGIIVENDDSISFANAIRKVIAMEKNELLKLRKNCQSHAKQTFCYKSYTDLVSEFIINSNGDSV